ncbi:MAG: hypothetical protein ACLQNE_36590 [Thermoguttaceae bacterium]
MTLEDDSSISEINILPDGRLYLCGASQQILEMLDAIPLGDLALRSRIVQLRATDVQPIAEPNEACSVEDCGAMNQQVRR